MRNKMLFAVAVLAMACMGTAQAQFSLRVGGLFPQGKYADASADYYNNVLRWGVVDKGNKGGAGIGAMIGAHYKIATKVKGLGFCLSADVSFNSLAGDINDYYTDMIEDNEDSYREYSVTLPLYLNIPLLAGINYQWGITEGIDLYGEGALGLNIRKVTDYVEYANTGSHDQESTTTYDMAGTFAFKLGAGVVFEKKYILSLDYYVLGASRLVGETTVEADGRVQGSSQTEKLGNINPSMLALKVGIML